MTFKTLHVPNSSSYHKDQKGSRSEGNAKAWYHRRDMMYNFLIHPSHGDLCYTVLLSMPTGYFNPYICQSYQQISSNNNVFIITFQLSYAFRGRCPETDER